MRVGDRYFLAAGFTELPGAIRGAALLIALSIGLAACVCAPRPTPLERTVELDQGGWLMRTDMVAASGRMEVAIAEYYNIHGDLPANNRDAGLPDPGEYRGQTLRSATVGSKGIIEFVFDTKSGKDGGRVRLVPDATHTRAMGLQWRCESSDYPQIKRILPTCDYVTP